MSALPIQPKTPSVPGSVNRADAPSLPLQLAAGVSRAFLLRHRMCPTAINADGQLLVAVADDAIEVGLDDLSVAYGRPVLAEPSSMDQVQVWIERLTRETERQVELAPTDGDHDDVASDVRDLANQPPVVRYVNLLVREAHEAGASDIHLEATRTGLAARLRIDGVLHAWSDPPPDLDRAVISRVKLLAELDIAERRRPQDGRIRVRLPERELDLRVSTVPTVLGESVVLRLLERGGNALLLEDLGMDAEILHPLKRTVLRSNGLILATGPTGSGKTTTLYSALGLRDSAKEKIVTVEDPVEYALPGVTQVPVHRQVGVTFASALRSILRQDPDVLFVGEMRDAETAELAIQAALTGHLVFSTLHTNDAVGAIPRLLDLGVPPFLIAATLRAVLAQRLVRNVCDDCAESPAPGPIGPDSGHGGTGAALDIPTSWRSGRGCAACRHSGYRGRSGVFELLCITDAFREAIVAGASRARFDQLAQAAGMRSMRADGFRKVRLGVTTPEEVLRVIDA